MKNSCLVDVVVVNCSAFLAFLIAKQLDFMHFASHVIHHVDKNQCSLKESIYCKICAKHHFISMYSNGVAF